MNLDEVRKQIDSIDHQILDLLNERVSLAIEVGKRKAESGAPVFVPSREEEVFTRLNSMNPGPLDERAVRAIYRQIISTAIALQRPLRIAYLGPEATYTHQAAKKQFGESLEYVPLNTIPDVFATLMRKEADYGVVPIENSTDGAVGIRTLDELVETGLKVVAQVYLQISHCLIGHGPIEEIEEVHSKDNALGQCRQWLGRMLPNARLVEASSTSRAVQLAKENPKVAAIAAEMASDRYGVPIIERNIQDKTANITRFFVIGEEVAKPLGEGRDKSSLVFTLHDEVGALQRVMNAFASRHINMTKIESRPSRQKLWDYFFFVDITGHIEDADVQDVFDDLKAICPMVKWLGSYPDVGL